MPKNRVLRILHTIPMMGIGTNFDRPDWKRLTADIEEGKIGCVIVKDMSRIGRNYLEVGFYTEVLFSTMGFPENWKELLQHK